MAYRHRLVLLALVINMVCYTDRVCIAIAGPELRTSFGLSATQMGLVFSIFSLSYFLGQTPWGVLADRYGSRSPRENARTRGSSESVEDWTFTPAAGAAGRGQEARCARARSRDCRR